MWFRKLACVAGMAALAACAPAVPDSGARGTVAPDIGRGVGFNNSLELARQREAERRAREAALSSSVQPLQTVVNGQPVPRAAGAAGPASQTAVIPARPASTQTAGRDPELVAIEARADAQARAANSGQAVVNASPSNAAPAIINNPGISSEQDFNSVSSQRSIEADAARIAANRAQRATVAPTALPTREGSQQPNIVAYALSTSHPRGTRVHRRTGFNAAAKFQRNCAVYASNDEAQIDFLVNGGPARDRMGLDPDGDGYACGWDPAPFRRIGG